MELAKVLRELLDESGRTGWVHGALLNDGMKEEATEGSRGTVVRRVSSGRGDCDGRLVNPGARFLCAAASLRPLLPLMSAKLQLVRRV